MATNLDITDLSLRLVADAEQRGWTHLHSPKNLAMALAGEVGELVAEFQWLDGQASEGSALTPDRLAAIEDEVADVFIYLTLLAARLNLDVSAIVERKVAANPDRHR